MKLVAVTDVNPASVKEVAPGDIVVVPIVGPRFNANKFLSISSLVSGKPLAVGATPIAALADVGTVPPLKIIFAIYFVLLVGISLFITT